MGALSALAFDPTQPLDNPRHEKFAQLCSTGGMSDIEAYQLAYGAEYNTAHTNAWTLRANQGIAERIRALQAKSAEKGVLSVQEKRLFLAKAVRSSIETLENGSELVQSLKFDRETGQMTEKKVVCKLKALELDARLAGELDAKPIQGITLHLHAIAPQAEEPVYDVDAEIVEPEEIKED